MTRADITDGLSLVWASRLPRLTENLRTEVAAIEREAERVEKEWTALHIRKAEVELWAETTHTEREIREAQRISL